MRNIFIIVLTFLSALAAGNITDASKKKRVRAYDVQ